MGGSQGFTLGYDAVDRQRTSKYYQLSGNTWTASATDAFSENIPKYATSSFSVDGKIEYAAMPEGKLISTGGATYQYEYFLQDHLGNNRVNFRVNANGTLGLSEVQNYYPLGKDMGDATMNYTASPQNLYKYSSKEIQQELSLMDYDFGARHYDPRIGRWQGNDALAESYEELSPFNYVANSPVNNFDPDGMGMVPCGDYHPGWFSPWEDAASALFQGLNALSGSRSGLAKIDSKDAPKLDGGP